MLRLHVRIHFGLCCRAMFTELTSVGTGTTFDGVTGI
jgi:hypothetical protein